MVGPDFGATPSVQRTRAQIGFPTMQPATFVDAVTPVLAGALPVDARMHLTGTLRQRGTEYMIEQRLDVDSGNGPRWTTPRIHRIMPTDATRDMVQMHIDRVVTIAGTPGCGDERNRTSIVIDSIQPFEGKSSQN